MSKAVRKQLFTILETLKKANDLLPKLGNANKHEDTLQLLADCQESAIAIGTQIETIYGAGLNCIHGLEDYCEVLYQIAEKSLKQKNCQMLYKQSSDSLRDIEDMMQQELPNRWEVVFLPYNVNMWDSLESIWLAARDDKDCDDYVIPIPYYDKNPDGSFGTLHYEGMEYPNYVPITGYEEYDFGVRCPDIIFIHNPYDECNYVTSIHPFFYSKNLKRFTETLVYVPYYVMSGREVSETQVVVPGVINADYVIVQNKTEQDAYIQILHNSLNRTSEKLLKEKILPLGSPKYDKVNSKEKNMTPNDWIKFSENKKVVLYNTTISAMLEDSERYLSKMEEVFKFFQNRKDAILLWRPHPLMEDTLKSMRKGYYEKYRILKQYYLNNKIGIFDDTPDMYVAIEFSDGYFGDGSSMLWLYQQTQKLAMIQNLDVQKGNKFKVVVSDIILSEDEKSDLFVYDAGGKIIFSYSIKDNTMTFLTYIGKVFESMYLPLVLYKNKMFFCPSCCADEIIIYNITNKSLEYISFPSEMNNLTKDYSKKVSYNENAFFIGDNNSDMFCLNMENYSIRLLMDWQLEFEKRFGRTTRIYMFSNICKIENTFWVALEGNNCLMQYNMMDNEFQFYYVGEQEIQYNTICYDGRYLWLSGDKDFITRWDMQLNQIKLFNNFPIGFKKNKPDKEMPFIFFDCYILNDNIYYVPGNANMIVKFNTKTGIMNLIKEINRSDLFFTIHNLGDKLYIQGNTVNQGKKYCSYLLESNDKIDDFEFCFNEEDNTNEMSNMICMSNNINEIHRNSLSYFIDSLYCIKTERNKAKDTSTCGERIYNAVTKN